MTTLDEPEPHLHEHRQEHGHEHGHEHGQPVVAAYVAGRPILLADVLAREAALRDGPLASRLPLRRTPQGRNVVRWIVQLMAAEQIVAAEAGRRGLEPGGSDAGRPALGVRSAVELGGVLATVLAGIPVATAVREAVCADVTFDATQARAYYERNLDEFTRAEGRELDQLLDGTPGGRRQPWATVLRGELPETWERVVFAAEPGVPIPVEPDLVLLVRTVLPGGVRPFDDVAADLTRTLREHAMDRHFAAWMQARQQRMVRLEPGFEHPADPSQADATHRH